MGRAPCCDKANVKRGPWSPEEDSKLKSYIDEHGTGGNWIALPQKIGLKRCGKSCRLRWLNYLRPNIKHGGFSEEEDNIICSLYISIGSRWSIIAAQLPGRTDNDIKNYWNTRLKKKLLGKHRKGQQLARRQGMMKTSANGSGGTSFNYVVPPADNQSPYWPELPVLAVPSQQQNHYQQQQQPCFNDHASIRKLLIKLGGRFHSDAHVQQPSQNGPTNVDHQLPIGIHPYTQQVLYDDHQQQHSSSPVANAAAGMMVSPHDQFAQQEHYMVNADNGMVHMFEGQNGHYVTDHQLEGQRLDGLEFLYGEEEMMMVMNNNMGWGEMQLLCPPPPPPPPPPSLEAASTSSSDVDYNNNNQGMERLNIPPAVAANELSGFDNVNGLSSYFAGVQ